MHLYRRTFVRGLFDVASYSRSSPKPVMFKKALESYAFATDSQATKDASRASTGLTRATTHPLSSNASAVNAQRPSLKRKFDRTLSTQSTNNLSQLHNNVFFDEKDFDDDDSLDLDWSIHKERQLQSIPPDTVVYPTLPPQTPSQRSLPSSEAVPWSTSPLSHFVKPEIPQLASPGEKPKKRRALPWADTTIMPVTETKITIHEDHPWDRSASAVKNEQKKLRHRNAVKSAPAKVLEKPRENVPATHLSEEQLAVVETVVDHEKSVFFTGSAGTGKSVLMRSIIARLKKKYIREPDRMAVTASTGLAACVIEGTTLHSWAGIGLGKDPVPELCKKIKRNPKTKTKWLRTKVLIIDEISMVDAELFDKLEAVARTLRNNGRPFGGIQLVITGDFFQLPPVPDRNTPAKFAFDAATWNTSIQHTILLTHVFRQKDPVFANMLNEMRLGRLSKESIDSFKKLNRELQFMDDVAATELFPTRGEVDKANNNRMQRLLGTVRTFDAVDSGVPDLNVRNKVLANFMAPEKLTLKKGAQVMLIKNIDGSLVNGTIGKVLAFMDEPTYQAYKADEPTYHLAHEEAGGSDEEEKAAARARFNAARYINKDAGPPKYWPLVRFPLTDGTYREMYCMPEDWKTENQQGEIIAKRVQVPLILSWALSIHKAQGQTLNRVKVDLGKVFEKGQAYVALSRATSQSGLQVLNFDPAKVMVHPRVIQFYEKLVSIHSVIKKKTKTVHEDGSVDEYEAIRHSG